MKPFEVKKLITIGTFATVAAGWSAVNAALPVVGPLLADTAGLTLLTIAMAYSLTLLYDKSPEKATLAAFVSVAVGAVVGNLALKCGASLIPIFGSYYNATSTFLIHSATGWALCEIYESGKSPSDLSSSEIRTIIKNNKRKAEEEEKNYEDLKKNLSESDKEKEKNLREKLKDNFLSLEEKTKIFDEIIALYS
ncbi:MAG: hypothetical protein IJL54_06410 [Prevotella sp.]|nr:hypothetical protein [Prevotella sp.]